MLSFGFVLVHTATPLTYALCGTTCTETRPDPPTTCPPLLPGLGQPMQPRLPVLLVLKFNYWEPACSAVELAKRWSAVFERVAVAGPFDPRTANAIRAQGLRVFVCLDDAGHYSPQESLLWMMREADRLGVRGGSVYMHDDMVPNVTSLTKWVGAHQVAIVQLEQFIPGGKDTWHWWSHSASHVNRGGRGGGVAAINATGRADGWIRGQADFVFLPRTAILRTKFVEDLQLCVLSLQQSACPCCSPGQFYATFLRVSPNQRFGRVFNRVLSTGLWTTGSSQRLPYRQRSGNTGPTTRNSHCAPSGTTASGRR